MESSDDAWQLFEAGQYGAAERAFRTLLARPEITDAERRQALYGLGYALAYSQQFAEARSTFTALQQEAATLGDAEAEHRALHQVGMVERMAGRWPEAATCFQSERRMIAALGNDDLAVSINAYELGLIALQAGRPDEAKEWADLGLTTALRTDDLVAVGCAYRALGDWHRHMRQQKQAALSWTAARSAFVEANEANAVAEIDDRLSSTGPWSRPAAPI